jgi:hypothetical protein
MKSVLFSPIHSLIGRELSPYQNANYIKNNVLRFSPKDKYPDRHSLIFSCNIALAIDKKAGVCL